MNTAFTGIFQRIVTFSRLVLTRPSVLSTREWDGIGVVWTLLILCATTMPWSNFTGQAYWYRVIWLPFADACWSQWFLSDVFENMLLFLPFGWCLVLAQRSQSQNCLSRVALLATTLSLAVEFFQVFSLRRSPSMTDVWTNTVGAIIAALQAIDCRVQERISRLPGQAVVIKEPLQPIVVPTTTASIPEPPVASHPW